MDKNKVNVPKIRFPGFTDPWEQRKLGDILTEVKRSIELEDNKIYELVTVKRRNEGVVSRGLLKGKDILVKNYFEIKAGDYIISKRQVIHGANGIVPQSLDKAIVSNEYLVSVGNENITTEFWTIISKLPDMYKKFFLSSYGVDIEKLVFDVEDWKKRIVVIPSLTEQKEITVFFKNLDNLITLHQRKLEHLQDKKKGLLQKMFPKEGEKFPEVRFSGFTEPWEQRNLIEQIDKVLDYRGKSPSKFGMSWGDSGYLVLSALNVKNGYVDKSVEAKYGGQALFDRWMGIERLEKDDVLFTTEAPLGNIAQVPDNDGYILNQRTVAFKTSSDKLDNSFLATLLSSPLFQEKLQANSSGGTAKGIGMKEFAKITVMLPIDTTEQKKIGEFIKSVNNLITLHQRKLNHLQEQKRALLQQMFI